jgi:hypothetical protein
MTSILARISLIYHIQFKDVLDKKKMIVGTTKIKINGKQKFMKIQ